MVTKDHQKVITKLFHDDNDLFNIFPLHKILNMWAGTIKLLAAVVFSPGACTIKLFTAAIYGFS
jgi:hypothetical protein